MLGHLNPIEEEAVTKLKDLLSRKLESNLKNILLYGSKSRGDYNSDSDIDILVVTGIVSPEVKDTLREAVLDIQLEYSLPISVHIRSLDYFNAQQGNKLNLFIRNIEKEGILV